MVSKKTMEMRATAMGTKESATQRSGEEERSRPMGNNILIPEPNPDPQVLPASESITREIAAIADMHVASELHEPAVIQRAAQTADSAVGAARESNASEIQSPATASESENALMSGVPGDFTPAAINPDIPKQGDKGNG